MIAKALVAPSGLGETTTPLPGNTSGWTLKIRGGAFAPTGVTWTRLTELTLP